MDRIQKSLWVMDTLITDSDLEAESKPKKAKATCCGRTINAKTEEVQVNSLYQLKRNIKKPERKRCMVYQDSNLKLLWEMIIYSLLVFICAVLPLNMAL